MKTIGVLEAVCFVAMGESAEWGGARMSQEQDAVEGGTEGESRPGWLSLTLFLIMVLIVVWVISRYALPSESDSSVSSEVAMTARVPDVVGEDRGDAVTRIERAGFVAEVDLTFKSTSSKPNTVVKQAPAPGVQLVQGGIVIVVVVTPEGEPAGVAEGLESYASRVPNVVGLTRDRADGLLVDNGYSISVSEGYSSSRPRGLVYSQLPESGSVAEPGTNVAVKISRGPAPPAQVRVPDVRGLTPVQAAARLKGSGFDPRSMKQWHEKYAGIVFQQNPAAGVRTAEGSPVFILSGEPIR